MRRQHVTCSCRHCQLKNMMTSSNGNFSALLALCAGNSPAPGEFPAQRPVTRGFGVFFDLRLNKQVSKQSWGWWSETLSRPFWRHCNEDACSLNIWKSIVKQNTFKTGGGAAFNCTYLYLIVPKWGQSLSRIIVKLNLGLCRNLETFFNFY